jgi:hypothetical protein
MKKFPVVEKLWPLLSLHLLKSVLQSLPHLMTSEKEIFFADKLSAECDQQFHNKELSNEKCATLVI